ncbi:MAG: 4'-phosphopantetheinyl transferase superfamily protein [Casimicrobiaceae bacterium]
MAVFVIATAASTNVRLGIDIELPDRQLGVDRLARKLMTDPERFALRSLTPEAARHSFLRMWTCKEAMSKATGDGLSAPFGRISVHPGDADQPQVLDGPAEYQPDGWALHRIAMPVPSFVTIAVHTA